MQITFHFVGCTWAVCLPSLLFTVYKTFFFFAYWFVSSFGITLVFHQYLFLHLERYQLPNTRMYICIWVLYYIVKTSALLFVLCHMSIDECSKLYGKCECNSACSVFLNMKPMMLQPGGAETRTCPMTRGCSKMRPGDCPSKYAEQTFLGEDMLFAPLHCLLLHWSSWKQNKILLINSKACASQTPQYRYSLMISCDFCQ